MKWRQLAAISLLLGGWCACSSAAEPAAPSSEGWKQNGEHGGVVIYSRPRGGSALKEFKAVGVIEAPTSAVHKVLDDVEEYTNFMPFTAEARIIKKENDAILAYQRVSPKICSDRDYTIRIRASSWAAQGGLAYLNKWESANEAGPGEKKGVLRVKLCDGAWLLEPEGPDKTRATYSIYTDTGGALPAFIANAASGIGIRKIFAAVRKQVKNPKYRAE